MEKPATDWSESLCRIWKRHGVKMLALGIAIMAIAMVGRVAVEFPRLLWHTEGTGAIDLKFRHVEVQRWFAGLPVYGSMESADYPPATYLSLWPLLGWLPLAPARWLWMLTSLAMLGWLAHLSVPGSRAFGRLESVFVAAVVFSASASQVAIGVGQLILHVLPLLLATGLLMKRVGRAVDPARATWREDVTAAGLFVFALAKPTVAAFFFWIVAFVPCRLRPAVLVVAIYGASTLVAGSFQDDGILTLLHDWRAQEGEIALQEGYANVHRLLAAVGLDAWLLPATAVAILALGVWVFRRRDGDVWLLLGVSGIVGRLAVHHRLYDDLMVLPAFVALVRLAKSDGSSGGNINMGAGVLAAAVWGTLIAPARLVASPAPWNMAVEVLYTMVWLGAAVFLIRQTRVEGFRPRG